MLYANPIEPRGKPAVHTKSGYLSISGIRKSYGATQILRSFDLVAEPGEFVTLLGPSGCGKTTLLRIVAGLLTPDSGRIVIEGKDITQVPTHRRNVGMMFQSYALFPHMTVKENVGFGLAVRKEPQADIKRKVAEALELVQLSHLGEQAIRTLSGGQQQRVAVARTLVVEPALILFDEPFSALDKKLREAMQIELKSILRRTGSTAIFVTHDQEEALALSDRIVVMNAGRVEQAGSPQQVYSNPASQFVLDFMGQSNKIAGHVQSTSKGLTLVHTAHGPVTAASNAASGSKVVVTVRPEQVYLDPAPDRTNALTARVSDVIFLGGRTTVVLEGDNSARFLVEITGLPQTLEVGRPTQIYWSPKSTALFLSENDLV